MRKVNAGIWATIAACALGPVLTGCDRLSAVSQREMSDVQVQEKAKSLEDASKEAARIVAEDAVADMTLADSPPAQSEEHTPSE